MYYSTNIVEAFYVFDGTGHIQRIQYLTDRCFWSIILRIKELIFRRKKNFFENFILHKFKFFIYNNSL